MRNKLKAAYLRVLWPLVAIAPSLVAMRGMFSGDEAFCYRDCPLVFLPVHRWFRRTILSGEWPWWDPYVACGQSAIAEPVRLILFPPVFALRLLPFEVLGYNLTIGLPFPVAALGVYALLRARLSGSAAALGGIVFATSSTMLSTGSMPNMSWSMALAPWTIWAVAAAGERRQGWWFSLAAATTGLQAMAGEPVTFTATLAVALAYAAVTCFSADRTFAKVIVWTSAAVVAGCLLAAIQYLPFAEAVALSTRVAPDAPSVAWQLHPMRLLEFVVPFPFTDWLAIPAEYDAWSGTLAGGREPLLLSHYLGVAVLALASLGVVSGPRRRAGFWAAVALVSLLCALGSHTPAYRMLLDVVPQARVLQFLEKYVLVAVLAAAVLAAEGWESLVSGRPTWRRSWVPLAVIALSAVAVAAVYADAPALAAAVGAGPDAAPSTRFVLMRSAPILVAVSVGMAGVIAVLTARRAFTDVARAFGVALVALDLLAAGAWLNPQMDAALLGEPEWVAKTAATGDRAFVGYNVAYYYLHRDGTLHAEATGDRDAFNPGLVAPIDTPFYAGIAMAATKIGAYSSQWGMRGVFTVDAPQLLPREYHEFEDIFIGNAPERRARALDRIGVRTQVRVNAPIGDYGPPEEISRIQPAVAYYSSKPFERVLVVPTSRVEANTIAAISALFDTGFEPSREALLERDARPAGTPGAPGTPSVRVLEDRPNSVRVEATAADGATLAVLDSYNPGWRAEVDGERAEVVRVDGLFYGVRLAPGTHTVSFVFRPASLVAGAWITAVTALVLAAIAAVSVASRRRGRLRLAPE